MNEVQFDNLTPRQIVAELDKYIIGQKNAKRAVAVALRNRIRRLKLPEEIRDEIAPKNILMIGPTGVGKTEIARRLAKLAGAPFIKVEATKYTEVGYVGRDVESMIRDLMAAGIQMVKQEMQEQVKEEASRRAEEALLDLLLPGSKPKKEGSFFGNLFLKTGGEGGGVSGANGLSGFTGTPRGTSGTIGSSGSTANSGMDNNNQGVLPGMMSEQGDSATREKLRTMLREGKLEDRMVELMVQQAPTIPAMGIMAGPGLEDLEDSLSGLMGMLGGGKKKKLVTVKRAREILIAEEAEKLIDQDRVSEEARRRVEETGIVFIDEIDKIAGKGGNTSGPDVSREGVQRDILPIVEGSQVNTKWGPIDTSHILFIGAGAFNVSKPSDLIPELQGRFPLRVELESLGKEEFLKILTEPKNALIKQYTELLSVEGITIEFTQDAIERLAALAAEVNSKLENIGARRLHTIMEALLEEISFEAPDISPAHIPITANYVDERLKHLVVDQDLGRYIL
ncbi:MAG: ATP-dependent protease ATPase subunit HslU [Termitinemataceae bacterium]